MEEARNNTNNGKLDDEPLSLNPVGLLQKRHTEPLHSHEVYLVPEVQPPSASAARGENPWTGQTADEVREAAFSQQQYQQMQHKKEEQEKEKMPDSPVSPAKEEGINRVELDHLRELDEIMFDTSM